MAILKFKHSAPNNEERVVRAAFERAYEIVGELSDALDIKPDPLDIKNKNPSPHIASWYRNSFGRFSLKRATDVINNINKLLDYLNNNDKTLHISLYGSRKKSLTQNSSPEHIYAFTTPGKDKITFESKFFTLNVDDQACVIIHELSHMLCNTEDYEFTTEDLTQGGVRQFAIESPQKAITCAYCYELFAQSYREIPEDHFAHAVQEIECKRALYEQEKN